MQKPIFRNKVHSTCSPFIAPVAATKRRHMQHAGAQLTAAAGSATLAHARSNATSRRPRSTVAAAASDDSPESATAGKHASSHNYSWAQYCSILFNVPNSIGWLRLLLLGAAVKLSGAAPWASLWLFAANMALDFADGVAARALNQVRCLFASV